MSIEFLAGMVFSAQAMTMVIASPIWGALADRYGRKLMVERAMFGGAAILFLMAFARSAEELVLLRAIQGLITGTVAAANALVASSVPRSRTGYAMGLLQVGLGAGVSLGPLLGGLIADAYGYQAAFYVTAALLLLSGVLIWWGVEEEFVKPETPAGQRTSLSAGWRHVLSAPGVTTTYAMRFISQMGRMMIVPIAPLFIQTLLSDTERLLLATGFVALIWGQVNFEPLDGGALFLESLKFSVPALMLFSWIALRLLRGRSGSHRELLAVLGLSLVAFPLCGFGGGVAANGWLDTSQPMVHQTMVLKKVITRNKNSTDYHLHLRSWRSPTDTEKLTVSKRVHDRVTPGKTVITVLTKKGYLGYEWWVSYGIAEGKVSQ